MIAVEPLRAVARLLPPIDIDGPRVRLGLLWAAVTAVAVAAGPVPTSLVFAAVALGAAGQVCRSWRAAARRPYRPVAVLGATAIAAAGAAGPLAVAAATVITALAAIVTARLRVGGRDWDERITIAVAVVLGAGAAAPSVVRGELGVAAAVALVLSIHAIDASAFIVGSGASSRWEGPAAGAASAVAVGLACAAVLVPPFRGLSPWVLAVLAGVLAPLGPAVGTMLLGRVEAPVPALRRLDSYLVAAPVWAFVGAVLLDV